MELGQVADDSRAPPTEQATGGHRAPVDRPWSLRAWAASELTWASNEPCVPTAEADMAGAEAVAAEPPKLKEVAMSGTMVICKRKKMGGGMAEGGR